MCSRGPAAARPGPGSDDGVDLLLESTSGAMTRPVIRAGSVTQLIRNVLPVVSPVAGPRPWCGYVDADVMSVVRVDRGLLS